MTTATIADHLAAAEAAAARPRQRVAELETRLEAAISASQFDVAHQTLAEIKAAREESVIADAACTALRQGADQARQDHEKAERAIEDARQGDQARQELARHRETEQQGLGRLRASLDAMWAAIADAQRHLRSALAAEDAVHLAKKHQVVLRARLGEFPPGHPGPDVFKPTAASELVDSDQIIKLLRTWSR